MWNRRRANRVGCEGFRGRGKGEEGWLEIEVYMWARYVTTVRYLDSLSKGPPRLAMRGTICRSKPTDLVLDRHQLRLPEPRAPDIQARQAFSNISRLEG